MKRGHPEEAEEDNTPFFHHPRASVFDEEEADDVAYKFFNQEHERGKKKDASILSQLELEESDETSQEENDHKYIPVPQLHDESEMKVIEDEYVQSRKQQSIIKSAGKDESRGEKSKKQNKFEAPRTGRFLHREPISFGNKNMFSLKNDRLSELESLHNEQPPPKKFTTSKEEHPSSFNLDPNSQPLKMEKHHSGLNRFNFQKKYIGLNKNEEVKQSFEGTNETKPRQSSKEKIKFGSSFRKNFKKHGNSKKYDSSDLDKSSSENQSSEPYKIEMNSDFPRLKNEDSQIRSNVLDNQADKNKRRFNWGRAKKQTDVNSSQEQKISKDSKTSLSSNKEKNKIQKLEFKKNQLKFNFSLDQPKQPGPEPQTIKPGESNDKHNSSEKKQIMIANKPKAVNSINESKKPVVGFGDRKTQKFEAKNIQNPSRITLTNKTSLKETEGSSFLNSNILQNPQKITPIFKDKKADVQVVSKGTDKGESKFVKDMIMLGDLASEVALLKRNIMDKRNAFSQAYRLEKESEERIHAIFAKIHNIQNGK